MKDKVKERERGSETAVHVADTTDWASTECSVVEDEGVSEYNHHKWVWISGKKREKKEVKKSSKVSFFSAFVRNAVTKNSRVQPTHCERPTRQPIDADDYAEDNHFSLLGLSGNVDEEVDKKK